MIRDGNIVVSDTLRDVYAMMFTDIHCQRREDARAIYARRYSCYDAGDITLLSTRYEYYATARESGVMALNRCYIMMSDVFAVECYHTLMLIRGAPRAPRAKTLSYNTNMLLRRALLARVIHTMLCRCYASYHCYARCCDTAMRMSRYCYVASWRYAVIRIRCCHVERDYWLLLSLLRYRRRRCATASYRCREGGC